MFDPSLWLFKEQLSSDLLQVQDHLFFVCCFEVTEEVRIYFRCVGRNCSSSTTTGALTWKVQKYLVDEYN